MLTFYKTMFFDNGNIQMGSEIFNKHNVTDELFHIIFLKSKNTKEIIVLIHAFEHVDNLIIPTMQFVNFLRLLKLQKK